MNSTNKPTLQDEVKARLLRKELSEKDFLLGLLELVQKTDVALGTHPHAYKTYELLNEDEEIRGIFENHTDLKDFWIELIRMSYQESSFTDRVSGTPGRSELSYRVYAPGPENGPPDPVAIANRKQLFSYHITINKPVKVVFAAMTNEVTYPEWTKGWGIGLTFSGELKQGEEVLSITDSGDGLKAFIGMVYNTMNRHPDAINAQPEMFVRMTVNSLLKNGQEIQELDDKTKRWIGTELTCDLTQFKTNETNVTIYVLAHKAFTEKIDSWDEALQNLKTICENKY